MKPIKLFILLFTLAALTSCGLFKTVSTETHREGSKTKTDSVYSSKVTDKTKTTITEKIDTVAETKPVEIQAEKPATIDSSGIVTAVLDTLMFRVKVSYDKLAKSVKFDIKKLAELVPVTIDRVTVIENDVKSESKGRVKKAEKSEVDDKNKVKEPDVEVMVIVIGVFCFVLVCVFLFLYYKVKQSSKVIDKVI